MIKVNVWVKYWNRDGFQETGAWSAMGPGLPMEEICSVISSIQERENAFEKEFALNVWYGPEALDLMIDNYHSGKDFIPYCEE